MSLGRRFKTFESISINGREMKSRVIRAEENITTRLKIATSKPLKARENSSNQGAIGVRFESDWLRRWREFRGPIAL